MLPLLAALNASGATEGDHADSPLKLYNDGTQKLAEGKLQEAEACLQGAVGSQNERIQPPALYNLGEARYRQGAEELKKGPSAQNTGAGAKQAFDHGTDAIKAVDDALVSEQLQQMVSAYMQGKGARKELKGAIAAVKQAMETYGSVLTKWQRAAGDFKSSHELQTADEDAKKNGETMDRYIAKLIDQQQMMAQAMGAMDKQRSDLGKKMAQLKKKMGGGEGEKLSGKGDEDDDDEDKQPQGPKKGDEEPGPKTGKEMQLSREEAARLLDMLKLDGNRKLSMGTNEMGKPKDRKGRDW